METNFVNELQEKKSGIKQRLGDIGRTLKKVDLRERIGAYPFAAIGIAAGVGAAIGLARPMPKRGPISGAFVGALTAIGFRVVRELAFRQIGTIAKNVITNPHTNADDSNLAARSVDTGTGVRYTPTL